MACKVSYAPDPASRRSWGLNPEKAQTLFQARTQPLRDPKGNPVPCEFCLDLRYKGRVGVFEMLVVDDDVKSVVSAAGRRTSSRPCSANSAASTSRKKRSASSRRRDQRAGGPPRAQGRQRRRGGGARAADSA
jgi:type II secretory ATPase GspE/PulE/Tfp pilus assembly ATPase PilB-like protein